MSKWIVGLAVVLLGGAVTAAALAGPGFHRGWGMMGPAAGGGPGWWCPWYGQGWGTQPQAALTPEQQQKLTELRQRFWKETQPLREQIFAKQQELWNLYRQPTPDQQAISRLQKELFDLRQQLAQKGFSFRQEAQKVAPGLAYGFGPGWGWGHMGPMYGGRHMGWMGPWGGHMMGPYAGAPCWGY